MSLKKYKKSYSRRRKPRSKSVRRSRSLRKPRPRSVRRSRKLRYRSTRNRRSRNIRRTRTKYDGVKKNIGT